MQNRISLPDRAPTKILWPLEQRPNKPGSTSDQGLHVWNYFSHLLNVPFSLKMQEHGPPLLEVASLFDIQFLFLNYSVVFQLCQGQVSKQGPERLCGFHPCTQHSLGQDAEQNDLILYALSWATWLETSREPFQPEFLYESAIFPTCAAGMMLAGVQPRGGVWLCGHWWERGAGPLRLCILGLGLSLCVSGAQCAASVQHVSLGGSWCRCDVLH